MYEINKYTVKIKVNLDNGFYILRDDSSTGKTYLQNLLRTYAGFNVPVRGYTHSDYAIGVMPSMFLKTPLKLIFLDRFDMYANSLLDSEVEAIGKLSKTAIVIAELKGSIGPRYSFVTGPARLQYTNKNLIEVEYE